MGSCKGWPWLFSACTHTQACARAHTLSIIIMSDFIEALSSISSQDLTSSAYGHMFNENKAPCLVREFIPLKISKFQNRVVDCLARHSRIECVTSV